MNKQHSLIVTTVVFTFFLILQTNAFAYTIDFASHEGESGETSAEVQGDGTNQITFDIGLASGTIADIRGFFFDIDSGLPVTAITVNSLVDLNNDFTVNNVITSWPTVSGSAGMQGAGDFDFGIELGSQGIGNNKGDIRTVNFTIFRNTAMVLGNDFGMRLMSFGDNRGDSRKMIGSGTPNPAPGGTPAPEPATMLLFGIGLAGIAGTRLRKKKKA